MSCFRCDNCGCIENTACSNYWEQKYPMDDTPEKPKLCSECDPETGKWHGNFDKRSAKGMILCDDGFLYDPEEVMSTNFKFRMKHQGLKIVKEITD